MKLAVDLIIWRGDQNLFVRRKRGRVVSIVYEGFVPPGTECIGGDDAAEALWLTKPEALAQELAFDHRSILELAR